MTHIERDNFIFFFVFFNGVINRTKFHRQNILRFQVPTPRIAAVLLMNLENFYVGFTFTLSRTPENVEFIT